MPRYIQLADIFRQRIVQVVSVDRTGDMLPSIEKSDGVSSRVARVTVRQADPKLSEPSEGLVSPQRGRGHGNQRGDRRRRAQTQTAWSTPRSGRSRRHVPRRQAGYFHQSSSRPRLQPDPDSKTMASRHPSYFHMRRVHSREGEHYCVASIFIDDRVFQLAPEQLRKEVAIPVLTSLPGVTIATARQTLHISTADLEIARDLEVPVNAPVAEVRRVFCSPDGSVIYLAEATYRGDYIRLEMDLK